MGLWEITWLKAAAVLMISVAAAWVQTPKLRQQKAARDLVVFYILLGIGTAWAVAEIFRVPIPRLLDGAIAVFQPVSDWFHHLLKGHVHASS